MVLRAMARTYFGFGLWRDHAALYAAMNLESATSPRLRIMAGNWAKQALTPLRGAVTAAMPTADAGQACEILIDLLDGAANRLRRSDESMPTIETVFSDRWAFFSDKLMLENRMGSASKAVPLQRDDRRLKENSYPHGLGVSALVWPGRRDRDFVIGDCGSDPARVYQGDPPGTVTRANGWFRRSKTFPAPCRNDVCWSPTEGLGDLPVIPN